MDIPNHEGKLNFLVQVHSPYSRLITGAVVALHKLAYKIAERGHYAYTFCKPEYPHPNIQQIQSTIVSQDGFIENFTWEHFTYPLNNTVVLYPQITGGNPFNVKNVARWIMYDTEKINEASYGINDELFNFMNFKTYSGIPDKKLTVLDYKFDDLYITNTGKRNGLCFINHKNIPPSGTVFKELGATNLTEWRTKGGYTYLREQFNKYEYMLTYDQASFYSVAAGLCGCKVIILNAEHPYEFTNNANTDSLDFKFGLTPTEFRLKTPLLMYGVAYGWDDIQWANNTVHMVRDHILAMEEIDNKQLINLLIFGKINYNNGKRALTTNWKRNIR
jgi:hypothetical protein